ncbi:MAG TPA: DeoR/GlpR family DNA-binding transcription regulator [Povalibacter sp.]
MRETERHRLIARLVQTRSVVSIPDLVETLDASAATVRRDINAMADRGEIRRIRGGAEALLPRHQAHLVGMPFTLSQGVQAAQKRAIARATAAMLTPGDSIVINGGTTTFALVEFLTNLDLDILTNSVPIVSRLLATSNNRVQLPGGSVYREQDIVLSPHDSDHIQHFWGSKLLTGCYGLNHFGLMESDPLLVQAEARLLNRAEQVIVMADSRKFSQRSSMIVAPLGRISVLVTDDSATEVDLRPFRDAGIQVIVAEVLAEDREVAGAAPAS